MEHSICTKLSTNLSNNVQNNLKRFASDTQNLFREQKTKWPPYKIIKKSLLVNNFTMGHAKSN